MLKRYKAGWHQIINIDYSPSVIQAMSLKCSKDMPEMKWKTADIFKLSEHFEPECFDVALDKGTLDALLTVKHDPWNPPESLLKQMHSYMDQVARVLVPGGIFLHITFAQPHFRRRFLETTQFNVSVKTLGGSDSFDYFIYHCQKI